MSDPLSLISSISGIISLADVIITRAAKLYISARDCPQEIKALVDETSSLSGLLAALDRRVLAMQQANGSTQHYVQVPGTAMILDDCEQTLNSVVAVITKSEPKPGESVRNTGKRLLWNFRKDEVVELIAKLERCKTNLQIALSLDGMEALHQLLSGTAEIVEKILSSTGDTILAVQESGNNVIVEMRAIEGRYVQSEENKRRDTQRHELLHWLSAVDHHAKHRDVQRKRCEDTGAWFVQGADFNTWLDPMTPPLLWCKGMPGAGKTFLTSIIVDHLKSRFPNPRFAITQVYFNFKERSSQTPEMILTSIIHQLLSNEFPTSHSHISTLHEKFFTAEKRPSSQEIFSAIEMISKDFTTVFLVFDALDECDEDLQRTEVLTYLLKLLHPPFKILVTSRPHPRDINAAFAESPAVTIFANSKDIEVFIKQRIADERTRGVTVKPELVDTIVEQIILKAGEMFLLASFQIEHILRQPTQKKMREAAKNLVSDLDVTYGIVMDRIRKRPDSQRQLALTILTWMIAATRPLHFQELQQAVAIEEGDTEVDEEAFPDTNTMIDLCGSLVTIEENGTVRFVHFTVQEYLLTHTTISNGAHLQLANTCLTYMSFDSFEEGVRSWDDMLDWCESSTQSFRGYALTNWGSHMKAIDEPEELVQKAMTVLTRYPTAMLIMLGIPDTDGYNFTSYSWFQSSHCLHIAARHGLSRLLIQLIENLGHGADEKDFERRTPLSWAARNGHQSLVQLLIDRADVVADWKDDYGQTPLSLAASTGQFKIVEFLVSRPEIDADSKNKDGRTPLSLAVQNGHQKIVELLVDRPDVDVESKDISGSTPLVWAAICGQLSIFTLLVDRPEVVADPKRTSWNRSLFRAASNGHVGIFELMVDRPGVDISRRDERGRNLVILAASSGHLRILELLLDRPGIDLNMKDGNWESPLSRASMNGRQSVVELLVNRPEVNVNSKNKSGQTPLATAAQYGEMVIVQNLLGRLDIDADSRQMNGKTPLSLAAENGYLDIVELLVDRRDVDVNSRNHYGSTPLILATEKGHLGIVELMLTRPRVNADSSDSNGWTPLSTAAGRGHLMIFELLINRPDVNGDWIDHTGRKLLSWAARGGHRSIVKLLLARPGADVDLRDRDGYSPLIWATKGRHQAVVDMLIAARAQVILPTA